MAKGQDKRKDKVTVDPDNKKMGIKEKRKLKKEKQKQKGGLGQ